MYPTVRSRQGGRVRTVSSGYKTYTESIRSSWGNFLVSEAIFVRPAPYIMSSVRQHMYNIAQQSFVCWNLLECIFVTNI